MVHPGGYITQGSGRIDPSSGIDRLTVDDVNARISGTGEQILLGGREFIINSNAVRKLGVGFLNNLNNIGLSDRNSNIPQGALTSYGSLYQRGGRVRNRSMRSHSNSGHGNLIQNAIKKSNNNF